MPQIFGGATVRAMSSKLTKSRFQKRTGSTSRSGAILYADLVESVRLNRSLGARAVDRWMSFETEVRGRITPVHGGQLIKSTGDGFLIVFPSADHALAAAFGMNMTLARENAPRAEQFDLRIGINWGTYADAGFDIFGEPVDMTQRLSSFALPGEIILSQSARDRIAPTGPATIDDLGPRKFKHIDELIQVFRASPPGTQAATRPAAAFRPLTPTIAIADITAEGITATAPLAERIADDLRRSLSRSVGLSISSRIDALLRSAGPADAVPYVVSGKITDAGPDGTVDVLLELAATRSGSLVWQHRFCASLSDLTNPDAPAILPIAGDISRHLIEAECANARGGPFDALESHTLLIASISLMYGMTPAGFACAEKAFETLAETSGRHPTPLAWLAIWHVLRHLQGWSQGSAIQGAALTARDLTDRALHSAASPEQTAHVQTARGLVLAHLMNDPSAAVQAYGIALSLAPTDGAALAASAVTLACLGEGEAASDHALRALSLSPLDPQRYFFHCAAALAFLSNGDPAEAQRQATKATTANPHFRLGHLALAIAAQETGDAAAARKAIRSFGAQRPTGLLGALPASTGPVVSDWERTLLTAIAAHAGDDSRT